MSHHNFLPVFDFLRKHVNAGHLPSAVFGVASRQGILALDAIGNWPGPGGRAVDVADPYLLWSVSKPITGLMMMQLWERGLISMAHEVKQYLPWFGPGRLDKVQLWHLMTHTAGISEQSLSTGPTKRDYLAAAGVNFRAGAHKQYSNQAFIAMEEILHATTGKSLETWLQDEVFGKLGMSASSYELYERDPGGFVPMMGTDKVVLDYPRFLETKHPAAGLFSNAPDLLKLGQCLLAGGRPLLSTATLNEMLRPQTVGIQSIIPADWTADNDFAYTWIWPSYSRGIIHKRCYGHNGWGGCRFWVYPDEGLCYVLMTNVMDPFLHGVDLEMTHNLFTGSL
jgi:CubicO group peptidase (beta-lactamase class C family)